MEPTKLRLAEHVTRMGKIRNAYILVGEPLGKRPLGIPKRREDNIKMGLRKAGCEDQRWMKLAQDRFQRRSLVLTVLNGVLV
jgi:hypothetical protein